ncbi:hypothetical protein CR513_04137, partial [Mucuna pruriens]
MWFTELPYQTITSFQDFSNKCVEQFVISHNLDEKNAHGYFYQRTPNKSVQQVLVHRRINIMGEIQLRAT